MSAGKADPGLGHGYLIERQRRPAFSIALMNLKGGTGKTTLAVALAETLTIMHGARTLIVDCDFQYSASIALMGRKTASDRAAEKATVDHALLDQLRGEHPMDLRPRCEVPPLVAREAGMRLEILPAGPDMARNERRIAECYLGEDGLDFVFDRAACGIAQAFNRLRADFDCIVYDCPPGLTLFSEAAVKACDYLLVPTLPNEISIAAIDHLRVEIDRIRPERPFDELHIGTAISKLRHRNSTAHRLSQMRSINGLLDRMDNRFRILRPYLPFCADLENVTWREPNTSKWGFAQRYASAARPVEHLTHAIVQNVAERQVQAEIAA